MRKGNMTILASVLTIALVAAGVGMGTLAYFTDTETSDGCFTAGTVDISVDGQNPWDEDFCMHDCKPCETKWVIFYITNVGQNPVDVWKHLTIPVYNDGDHPESEDDEDLLGEINNIGSVIRYDMIVTLSDGTILLVIDEADGYTIEDGDHHLDGITDGIACYYIYLGQLQPGETMFVEQSYHMDADTTNWAQGDEMWFTIEIVAQQTVNNPPPPGTELPGHSRDPTVT